MEILSIQSTPKSPYVRCDASKRLLEMTGRCIIEDSDEFIQPIFDWLNEYKQMNTSIEANFRFEYYNTSFSRCLFGVFKKLETIYKMGVNVTINWYYDEDDEDMLEEGQDFDLIVKIPFNFFVIKTEEQKSQE